MNVSALRLACVLASFLASGAWAAEVAAVTATPHDAMAAKSAKTNVLHVAIRMTAPVVDGQLDEWSGAEWAKIDDNTAAALCFTNDRMYAAFRTQDRDLLQNSGDSIPGLFKNGGALDVVLATNVNARMHRQVPTVGNLRLLVTRVEGKPVAALYRPVAPGNRQPVQFSSPAQTVTFDRVDDVSAKVEFASAKRTADVVASKKTKAVEGEDFEFSIPLEELGLHGPPGKVGQFITGDLGVLRGTAGATTQRVYWHNKVTGLLNDDPGQAALVPPLWGRLELVAP